MWFKKLTAIVVVACLCFFVAAQDSKISDLSAITTLAGDELFYVVDDPGGTPVSRKITANNSRYVTAGCRVHHNADQTLAHTGYRVVALNSERYDRGTCHDNSTNNSRITIPAGCGGVWTFTSSLFLTGTAGNIVYAGIYANGSTTNALAFNEVQITSAGNAGMSFATEAVLSAGDYIELVIYPVTTDVVVESEGTQSPEFTGRFIGP